MRWHCGAAAIWTVCALVLSACAVSPSTGGGLPSQSSQSLESPQSAESSPQRRGTASYLAAHTLSDLPFQLWVPSTEPDPAPVLAGLNGPIAAVPGRDFVLLGRTRPETDAGVLTLMEGPQAFGTGVAPSISRATVGLIGTDGEFTAWSEAAGVQEPTMLPGAAPFQSLNATGAAANGPVVVWMSVGAGGKQWSLMGWNTARGAITELASSASMTLGFTGISAQVVPGLEPPEVNEGFAYFQVAIPQNVYDAATPGMRFHEIEVTGQESPDYDVAVFRVALDSPGDSVFVGPSAQINADPEIAEGIFWVSSPSAVASDERTEAEVERFPDPQSGGRDPYGPAPELTSALDDLSLGYRGLLRRAVNEAVASADEPSLILWADSAVVRPLVGVGPAQSWAVSDVDASADYLVIALTKMSVVRGEDGAVGEGPPSWIVALDLRSGTVAAAAKSEVAVPDLFVSGDLVVWAAAADLSNASDAAVGAVTDEGASDGFVWRIGSESVYQLSSENAVVGPQVFGDTIAIRQVDAQGDAAWSFLDWRAQ